MRFKQYLSALFSPFLCVLHNIYQHMSSTSTSIIFIIFICFKQYISAYVFNSYCIIFAIFMFWTMYISIYFQYLSALCSCQFRRSELVNTCLCYSEYILRLPSRHFKISWPPVFNRCKFKIGVWQVKFACDELTLRVASSVKDELGERRVVSLDSINIWAERKYPRYHGKEVHVVVLVVALP